MKISRIQLINILRETLLIEGRFESRADQLLAKTEKKFPDKINQMREFINKIGPLTSKNVGFLNWGSREIERSRTVELPTIVDEVITLIRDYISLRGMMQPDIYAYRTLPILRHAVADARAKRESDEKKKERLRTAASLGT